VEPLRAASEPVLQSCTAANYWVTLYSAIVQYSTVQCKPVQHSAVSLDYALRTWRCSERDEVIAVMNNQPIEEWDTWSMKRCHRDTDQIDVACST
jgi:hypothetical protein